MDAYIQEIYDKFLLPVGAGLVVLIIIWNGYRIITSSGDPEAQKDARDWIIGALAGLTLLILAGVVYDALRSGATAMSIPSAMAAAKPFTFTGAVSGSGWTTDSIIQKIVSFLVASAGGVAVIFLIWGGWKYLINAGNEEETGKAKKTMLWAIIGLIVVLISWAFLDWLLRAL